MEWAKQVVIEVLDSLPDDCSLEDILHELYVRQKLAEGEGAADRGETVPRDDREARERRRLPRYSLRHLLEQVEDGNLHGEVPTGRSVGRESR